MINFGTITSVDIDTNKDGTDEVRLLTVEVYEDDPVTVELRSTCGDDYLPAVGGICFFGDVSESYSVGISTDDGIAPDETIEQGERELYSYENGARKAKIRLKKDGDVVVNDGTDFAVKYNELKKAFDQLKADHDSHIHTTTATVGASASVGVIAPPAASTANMAPAKVEKVRL